MHISRRNFLQRMTASAGTLWSSRVAGWASPAGRRLDCVVLDLESHCVLRESFAGYRAAFAREHPYLAANKLDSRWRCRVIIVPGLGMMEPAIARTLLDLVRGGSRLVLESGAGFLSPPETAAHRRMLLRCFALEVELPVDLWSSRLADDRPSIPYVRYVWPREIMVRDFTRVIPVSAKGGEAMAWAGSLAVGSKKPVGKGTLIFLGSPLGPALRTGDPEARSWLESVVAL